MMDRGKLALVLIAFAACEDDSGGDANWLTAPTPQTHEQYFSIASGPHQQDCNVCHGAFPTFKQFTCLDGGCHPQAETDPHHTSNPDYRYASVACYGCHPWGWGDGADHTRIFPIASGDKHGGVRCRTCHDDPANHKNVDCMHSGCHVDPDISNAHINAGVVSAYQPMSAQCLRCHADSQVNPVAQHLPFRISSRHNDCIRCHPGLRTDRPYPAQDFSSLDCFQSGCHSQSETNNHHAGFAGYTGTPTNCLMCHPNGSGGD